MRRRTALAVVAYTALVVCAQVAMASSVQDDVSALSAFAIYAALPAAIAMGLAGRLLISVAVTLGAAVAVISVAAASPGLRTGWESLWAANVLVLTGVLCLAAAIGGGVRAARARASIRRRRRAGPGTANRLR